jgi:large subunit ribosomal protein L22
MEKVTPKTESAPLVVAHARQLHVAPRKMRLVTNMVKNMNVGDALTQLAHTNKKAAPMVVKLLQSAVANAQNNFSLSPDHLYIKSITTDQGDVMKRYFPRARGSAFVIRRKLSQVHVVLEERKKGKASSNTSVFFKKKEKPVEPQSIDAKEATNTKPDTGAGKKTRTIKSSEQVKENTVANKRRLFNRKSGE